MSKEIRILEVIPDVADGTSWYRGRLPNAALEKMSPEVRFIPVNSGNELRWSELVKCDMVFMQRPTTDQHVNTIINCRRLGVPVWIDYDDLLTDLPDDNAHKAAFDSAVKNIIMLLDNATVITCSTQYLADRLSLIGGRNFEVIPNAWFEGLGMPRALSQKASTVFWRGSALHQRDLMDAKEAFSRMADHSITINMVGHKPWFYDFDVRVYPYTSLLEYFAMLGACQLGSICIVPLTDNHFNRSKSCNGWMEATYAGAVTVAPSFDEWRKPGCMQYSSYDDLYDIVTRLLLKDAERAALWEGSAEYIKENLSLYKINIKRLSIILKNIK